MSMGFRCGGVSGLLVEVSGVVMGDLSVVLGGTGDLFSGLRLCV